MAVLKSQEKGNTDKRRGEGMQVPSYSCIKGVESRGVSLSRKSSAAKPEGQRVLERKKNLAKVRMGGNTLVRMRGIFD